MEIINRHVCLAPQMNNRRRNCASSFTEFQTLTIILDDIDRGSCNPTELYKRQRYKVSESLRKLFPAFTEKNKILSILFPTPSIHLLNQFRQLIEF